MIVAARLCQQEADWDLLHPMVELSQANLACAGVTEEVREVVADAGYPSKTNLESAEESEISFYIAIKKDRLQAEDLKQAEVADESVPDGLDIFERMGHRLKTEKGREAYSKRGRTVEPVFGQIKDGRRTDRFMRRGLAACASEWSLMCTAHNLSKLFRWKAPMAM